MREIELADRSMRGSTGWVATPHLALPRRTVLRWRFELDSPLHQRFEWVENWRFIEKGRRDSSRKRERAVVIL
ncbi:hypothetical protein FCV25MIE_27026 [Fagus crenata]